MTSGYSIMDVTETDIWQMIQCSVHIGAKNLDHQMTEYIYKRREDGICVFNIRKTWEKLVMAARAIVAVENPKDVCVISGRSLAQRAILKFATYTGATAIAGRFTPGTFTNQIQKAFKEPRLLVVTDPRIDHQAITEASFVNIPVVAFCDTDTPLRYVDIAIPCNNKGAHSIGYMWWMLAREVLRIRGYISRELPWEVMVDMFFFRVAEEQEKEEVKEIPSQREIEMQEMKTKQKESIDFFEPDGISRNQTESAVGVEPIKSVDQPEQISTTFAFQNWGVKDWSNQVDNDDNWGGAAPGNTW